VRLDEPSVQRAGHRVADIDALIAALAAHQVFSRSGDSA
jgi:electron transfer flavoprotein beta subunit